MQVNLSAKPQPPPPSCTFFVRVYLVIRFITNKKYMLSFVFTIGESVSPDIHLIKNDQE